jgi:hypothetical protein
MFKVVANKKERANAGKSTLLQKRQAEYTVNDE